MLNPRPQGLHAACLPPGQARACVQDTHLTRLVINLQKYKKLKKQNVKRLDRTQVLQYQCLIARALANGVAVSFAHIINQNKYNI